VDQQLLLAFYAAGVAPHAAIRADDPVARADDGQGVGADRGAQRLDPVARDGEPGGQLAVADRRAVRDGVQGLPDPLLEFGAARGQIEAEDASLAREVLGELVTSANAAGSRRQPSRTAGPKRCPAIDTEVSVTPPGEGRPTRSSSATGLSIVV